MLPSRAPSAERRKPTALELPRIVAPEVQAPRIGVPTEQVSAALLGQMRDELAASRARLDAGDFAGAYAGFRATRSRIDATAARHLPSPSLLELRGEADREARRAREACDAVNAVARRRNGRVVACE